jgi:hypothetical protein
VYGSLNLHTILGRELAEGAAANLCIQVVPECYVAVEQLVWVVQRVSGGSYRMRPA